MDKLSASEAVYGFAGWVTTRKESICAGADHDCAIWAELVNEFCEANGLAEPREQWAKGLIHPKEDFDMDNFGKELTVLINKYCIENSCDIPDHLLSAMTCNLIATIGNTTKRALRNLRRQKLSLIFWGANHLSFL